MEGCYIKMSVIFPKTKKNSFKQVKIWISSMDNPKAITFEIKTQIMTSYYCFGQVILLFLFIFSIFFLHLTVKEESRIDGLPELGAKILQRHSDRQTRQFQYSMYHLTIKWGYKIIVLKDTHVWWSETNTIGMNTCKIFKRKNLSATVFNSKKAINLILLTKRIPPPQLQMKINVNEHLFMIAYLLIIQKNVLVIPWAV